MSNADWWAKKLGNPAPTPVPQARQTNVPPTPLSQQPMAQMPVFQHPQPSKAQSAHLNASCPDCGSGNYFAASPQTHQRCYDCGYPVQQSGSRYGSLAGAHVEGGVKASIGNSGTSGFNPIPDGYGPNGQKLS